jgi:hypothetical protein
MLMSVLDLDLQGGVKFVFSICFEIDLVVSVLSNRKIYFLVLQNKPKINRNKLSFGLFRFETKFFC